MDELAQRLARGEAAAFAELYDACADRLHHYLTLRLGSRTEAEDVVQEVFVRLVRSRHRLRGVERPLAYVFAMARNEAIRHQGRQARETDRQHRLSPEDLFLVSERDSRAREAADLAAAGLSYLSPEQREVVELKVYCGFTFQEIGEAVGVPLATAASRYRAALERLKDWWARQPT